MKIRPYTAEETDKLIGKFSEIADYNYAISEAVFSLIQDKYSQYLDNFSASLFKWSPYNFEKFCKQFSDGFRFTEYNRFSPNLFEEKFLNKPLKVLRHTSYHKVFDDVLTRYGVAGFTEDELELISDASLMQHTFVFNWDLHSKYKTLVKYASRPFEFDETDIQWLEQVERLHVKAKEWNSN